MKHRLVALAATLTLIAGIVSAVTFDRNPLKWDPRVLPIVHFVEKTRGLTFKHAVPVDFLSDAEFEKHVTSTPEEDKQNAKDIEDFVGRLRALDLLHGTVDLTKAENDLRGSSVVGLYVPSEKAVFVRGAKLSPYVRTTLAHDCLWAAFAHGATVHPLTCRALPRRRGRDSRWPSSPACR